MSELLYKDLGRLDYLAALVLQEQLVARKQRGSLPDVLLFVEHPHVYTLGRGGRESNVLAPQEVPVIRTTDYQQRVYGEIRGNWGKDQHGWKGKGV